MTQVDGLAIAHERIALEADEKTGFLDLGSLGLDALPDALFTLTHLRRLNLGAWFVDDAGDWKASEPDLGPNRIEGQVARLAALHRRRVQETAPVSPSPSWGGTASRGSGEPGWGCAARNNK